MAICSERPSAVLWKRISPSVPPAAGLGAAEQPPAALTQVLCICSWPSVVSAIARIEVQRSTRTRMPISATRAPWAKSKVEATGEGLLSMKTRSCLMRPRSAAPKRMVRAVAVGSGVFDGASSVKATASAMLSSRSP
jgi:hypothetical protein